MFDIECASNEGHFQFSLFYSSCFYGSVRLPNYKVQSLTDTDLVLSEFCERSDGIPRAHTINVSSKFCHLLVFFIIRTFQRTINNHCAVAALVFVDKSFGCLEQWSSTLMFNIFTIYFK